MGPWVCHIHFSGVHPVLTISGKIVDFVTREEAGLQGIISLGQSPSAYTVFPVVEFLAGKYSTVAPPPRILIPVTEMDVKNSNGTIRAQRIQIPLMLAWYVPP